MRDTVAIGDPIAACSFCGKPSTSVERLVAGPGVYICNECVDLATWVVEDASRAGPEESFRRRAEHRNPPSEAILSMLPALILSAQRIENELTASVSSLRERGADWQTIADAAGTSVDAIRRRFGATTAG